MPSMSDRPEERPPAQFSLYLPADLADQIDEIAKRRGTSRAQILREWAILGVEREAMVRRLAEAV